jgi:DNA-binding MarR family transcriptional regulator
MYYSYVNEKIAFSLIHAAQSIEGHFEKALAAVNLSGPKFAALSVLVAQDQPLSLSELAKKLTCVRSNVTQLVDRLEADGLVKRTDDPSDRRGVRAEATKLGRMRHAAGLKVVNRVHAQVAKQLSAIDQSVLKRALDAIQ